MRYVTLGTIARRKTPRIRAVPLKVFRIRNRVSAIDQSDVAIVLKIRRCIAVVQAVRIESYVRVVGEEQRTPGAYAYIEFDSVIGMSIAIMISIVRTRPASAIADRHLRLARPSGVIHVDRYAVGRRRHGEQIRNHDFVESDERMVDLLRPFW